MRKLFIIITLIVVSLVARAQVYDGITQPTKFRIFMPVTTSLHGNGSTVAPLSAIGQMLRSGYLLLRCCSIT